MSCMVSTSTSFFENPYGDPHIIKNGRFTDVTPIKFTNPSNVVANYEEVTNAIRFTGSTSNGGGLIMFVSNKKYQIPKRVCCTYSIGSAPTNTMVFGLVIAETKGSMPTYGSVGNGAWAADGLNGANGTSRAIVSSNVTTSDYSQCLRFSSGTVLDVSARTSQLSIIDGYLAIVAWVWSTPTTQFDISDLYIEV